MKTAYIMRGVPGSGKSTYIKNTWPKATVCSADSYFTEADGTYVFISTNLGLAHAECLRSFVAAVQRGDELVVCDNTNICVADMAPYVAVAEAYGYDTMVITLDTDPTTATFRNVHAVPEAAVTRMARSLQEETARMPKRWTKSLVRG